MDINDERNFLYLAMVKLTEKLQHKAVLLENVLAMIEANGGVGCLLYTSQTVPIQCSAIP